MRTIYGCLKQVRMHCISANTLNKAGTLHQDTCTFLLAKGNTIQRILNPRTNAPLTLDISLCVVAAPFVRNRTLPIQFPEPAPPEQSRNPSAAASSQSETWDKRTHSLARWAKKYQDSPNASIHTRENQDGSSKELAPLRSIRTSVQTAVGP